MSKLRIELNKIGITGLDEEVAVLIYNDVSLPDIAHRLEIRPFHARKRLTGLLRKFNVKRKETLIVKMWVLIHGGFI